MSPQARAFLAADQIKCRYVVASTKFYSVTNDHVPVVIDSGASTSVTPFANDFVGAYTKLSDHKVEGITEDAIIEGVGEVECTVYDHFGKKGVQKELLHWHWRLGHASQKRVQGLMRKKCSYE